MLLTGHLGYFGFNAPYKKYFKTPNDFSYIKSSHNNLEMKICSKVKRILTQCREMYL